MGCRQAWMFGQGQSTEAYAIRDFLVRSVVEFEWITCDDDCDEQLGLPEFAQCPPACSNLETLVAKLTNSPSPLGQPLPAPPMRRDFHQARPSTLLQGAMMDRG
jgi:hypothetical protein